MKTGNQRQCISKGKDTFAKPGGTVNILCPKRYNIIFNLKFHLFLMNKAATVIYKYRVQGTPNTFFM